MFSVRIATIIICFYHWYYKDYEHSGHRPLLNLSISFCLDSLLLSSDQMSKTVSSNKSYLSCFSYQHQLLFLTVSYISFRLHPCQDSLQSTIVITVIVMSVLLSYNFIIAIHCTHHSLFTLENNICKNN